MDVYYLSHSTLGSVILDQVQDRREDFGITPSLQFGDGEVDPRYIAVGAQSPVMSCTTTQIAAFLDTIGIAGLALPNGSDDYICWWQKGTEGGVRAGASSHLKQTINKGMIIPVSIRAGLTPPATLNYNVITIYDGTNDPIVYAASQSLSGTVDTDQSFVAGPLTVNGTSYEGVQDLTINFGLTPIVVRGDGKVWPLYCAIERRAPSISATIKDAGKIVTVTLDGLAISSTTCCWLKKVAAGGTRVADATEQHVKFTVTEGLVRVASASASGTGSASVALVIDPTYDGSNAIMAIDTTSAIS